MGGRSGAAVGLVLAGVIIGEGASAGAANDVAVTVHGEDYARLEGSEWERVKKEVEQVYRAAGVALRWAGPLRVPKQDWPPDGVPRVAIAIVNLETPFG